MALLSGFGVAALAALGLTLREEILRGYHLLKLQSSPDYLHEIAGRPERSPPWHAIQSFRKTPEGEEAWLIFKLRSKVPAESVGAAADLGALGSIKAVPYLLRVLAEAGAGPAVQSWIGLPARGSRPSAYSGALFQIVSARKGAAVPLLVPSLGDRNPKVSKFAAVLIGSVGPEARAAVPALIETLRSGAPDVVPDAVRALGGIGPGARSAVTALINVLGTGAEEATVNAAWSLGEIGKEAKPAVPALVKALATGSPGVRWMAAQALGKMGSAARPAVPALTTAIADGALTLRSAAAQALARIEGSLNAAGLHGGLDGAR